MMRYLIAVMAALLLPVLSSAQCLTTLPPNPPFVPPEPYLQQTQLNDMFWYGTDALWTSLGINGKWQMHNNVLTTKLTFWSRDFDFRKELEPKLIVTGKRLDGDAPSVAVAHANAVFVRGPMPAAMMTGIDIPTAGCWEITAHYKGRALTFIVSVGQFEK
jgi:hypothetical protein